jgi:hypothetical protein
MTDERKMEDTEMDHILSRKDEIVPSSGFAVSVMEAVRQEAAAPPPIAFPWKRALPGLLLAGLAIIAVIVGGTAVFIQASRAVSAANMPVAPAPLVVTGSQNGPVMWTGLAVLIAFVSFKFSMRLAGGRG